jgi:hypothetical protein
MAIEMQLIGKLGPGAFLRLAHGRGKVHRVYVDRMGKRICRSSMLERGSQRDWEEVNSTQYHATPCDVCK